MDFSETIADCDLIVGRCRQLFEFMTMRVFKDLGRMSFTYKN